LNKKGGCYQGVRGKGSLAVIAAIPCLNEQRFIRDTVIRAREHVTKVIVIDDGSTDDTAKLARAAGAQVVRHAVNRGYGQSIQSCFQAAKKGNANILVTLDGDGQHNPDEIPQVLAPVLNGEADLVIGSRFLQSNQSTVNSDQSAGGSQRPTTNDSDSGLQTMDYQLLTNVPRYRKFGIDVITFLYNLGSKVKVSDSQSGFRAHSRRLLEAVNITEKGFGFSVEVLIQARKKGFTIREVPISCIYHSQGSSLNPLSHGLGVACNVVKLRVRSRFTGGAPAIAGRR